MTENKQHDPRLDWVLKHSYFGTGKKQEKKEPREFSVRPANAHEREIAQRLVGAAVEIVWVFVCSGGEMRVKDTDGNQYSFDECEWQE